MWTVVAHSVNYFEGPPYKFKLSNKDHQRFVNCVRFNPAGTHYATVSSDTKVPTASPWQKLTMQCD